MADPQRAFLAVVISISRSFKGFECDLPSRNCGILRKLGADLVCMSTMTYSDTVTMLPTAFSLRNQQTGGTGIPGLLDVPKSCPVCPFGFPLIPQFNQQRVSQPCFCLTNSLSIPQCCCRSSLLQLGQHEVMKKIPRTSIC